MSLSPFDRQTGTPTTWQELKSRYPSDVRAPTLADTEWKISDEKIELSWQTVIDTFGNGSVQKSRASFPSEIVPLSQATSWEDFRRFARELEPYRYIFRGQMSNRWRLRTSFHRTGRTSLVKFMLQDIPTLHRHLSDLMSHHLDLRDPCKMLRSITWFSTTAIRLRCLTGRTRHSLASILPIKA